MSSIRTARPSPGRVAAFVLLALLAIVALASGVPRGAAADSPETAVMDWNKHALDALANPPVSPVQPPPPTFLPGAGMTAYIGGINLALVHGAIYDAVNSIDGG